METEEAYRQRAIARMDELSAKIDRLKAGAAQADPTTQPAEAAGGASLLSAVRSDGIMPI